MSIFSRKSKSNQSQPVNGKHTAQAHPRGSKNVKPTPIPQPEVVDPIVQRMALQAASRRRMNSETPDYSISSAPSGTSTPNQGHAASLASRGDFQRPNGRALQDDGLAKSGSAESNANSIAATNPHRQVRDAHRLRKSTGTISSQTTQPPYLDGVDPDLQKMRMPAADRRYPTPQTSRDSGYSSVAHTPTTDSSTQNETNTPRESELLHRHRKINAALQTGEETPKARSFSLPVSQLPPSDSKSASATAPRASVERERRDSKTYVSRLDPGSASLSFLASTVTPQVTRPKSSEIASKTSTLETGEQRKSQVAQKRPDGTNPPSPEKTARRKSRSSLQSETAKNTASNTGGPRESRSRGTEPAQSAALLQHDVGRIDSRPPQTKRKIPEKPASNTYVTRPPVSPASSPETKHRSTHKSAVQSGNRSLTDGTSPQIPLAESRQSRDRRSFSTPRVPYQTNLESPSSLSTSPTASKSPVTKRPEPPTNVPGQARAIGPFTKMGNQNSQILPPAESSNEPTVPSTTIPHASAESATADNSPTLQMRFPTPAPQNEFPYLAGIEKGATLPSTSALEGYKVNRRGHILDEEGDVIGELTEGEIVHCVRQRVNAQGQVVDESGKVVGQAKALPSGPISPMVYDRQRGSISGVYNESMRSPVSPATPHERRESASAYISPIQPTQQSKAAVEKLSPVSKHEPNTVYFELDASVESQAVPIIDHSEIFIPPFRGSQPHRNSKSATSLPETERRATRRSTQPHTPSASQDRNIIDPRRTSKISPSKTTEDINSRPTPDTEQAQPRRSYTLAANNAPKAVLGPTWESLLDTVPDSSQVNPQNASTANRTSVVFAPQPSAPPPASAGSQTEAPSSTAFGNNSGNAAASATAAQTRRISQSGISTRSSTHRPFAKSPLGSGGTILVASAQTYSDTDKGAAPGTVQASSGGDAKMKTAATTQGGMRTSTNSNVAQMAEEDDQAAPAPSVMKWSAAKSTKSGGKRRSIFGILLGKKEQVITVQ